MSRKFYGISIYEIGAIVLIALSLYYIVTHIFTQHSVVVNGPSLACDTKRIVLPDCERGQSIFTSFKVANTGSQELVLSDFKTSCSCSTVKVLKDGEYLSVSKVSLQPQQISELFISIRANVPSGGLQRVIVQYSTNDPNNSIVNIEAIIPNVLVGVNFHPIVCDFGSVSRGEIGDFAVEVLDYTSRPRSIKRVSSTMPDVFQVNWHPTVSQTTSRDKGTRTSPCRLGFVTVRCVAPSILGDFRGKVQLFIDGADREPDEMMLHCRVIDKYDILPEIVVLPKRSASGSLLTSDIIVKSTSGIPFELSVAEPSFKGVKIVVNDPLKMAAKKIVTVSLDSESVIESLSSFEHSIQLTAKQGNNVDALQVPFLIQKEFFK